MKSEDERLPISQVADILEAYCRDIAALNLESGAKRRSTGPRQNAYLMLSKVYELVYHCYVAKSKKIVFRILKYAKLEALRRNSNCDLLDDKKLSAWASACETLLSLGVAPTEFFEALEKYRGLEGLRSNRYNVILKDGNI